MSKILFDISIVIVSFNTRQLLNKCLDSIVRHIKEINYEIIVVDNASSDGSVEAVEKIITGTKSIKGMVIKNTKNLGFAAANNQGIKKAKGRYVLLLNSDTEFTEDSLRQMVSWMDKNPKAGISTCTLLNSNKTIQATGGYFPGLFRLFLWGTFLDDLPLVSVVFRSYHPHSAFHKKLREQDWITGAFFLIRGELIEQIGVFDEKFFMYVEEIDYCFRAKKKGWEVWYVPDTAIIHIGGASSKGESIKFIEGGVGKEQSIIGEFEGLKRLYKKHYPAWQYPLLTSLLKLAALLRFVLYGFLKGESGAKRIYAKAFRTV